MKLFKFGLQLWMTLASVVSFLLGWIVLAHSQKPTQPQSSAATSALTPLPTLLPLSPLNFTNSSIATNQPLSVQPVPTQTTIFVAPQPPAFTTGGS